MSTMNIQHLESLADIVEGVTGVPVRERVPDAVLDEADEVELVDLTPHALRQRIRHGNVYPPDRAAQALDNYFREGNLTALREMVLRRLSTTVEGELQEYMLERGVDASWPACEGVMVVVDASEQSRTWSAGPGAQPRGSRLRSRPSAVDTPAWGKASPEDKARLEENLRFAEDIGAEVTRLREGDAAAAILKLARDRNVESIFVGRPSTPLWRRVVAGQPLADQLIERGRDERVGIHVTTSR